MSERPLIERAIDAVLRLDSGERARLRRGATEAELLLIPALGGLLGPIESDDLRRRYLDVARIAAILERDEGDHPATVLARVDFHHRRMSRLLAADDAVLRDRLLTATRFLAAKRDRGRIAPFFCFREEAAKGVQHRVRAEWARRYGQELNRRESERRRASVPPLPADSG